MNGSEIESTQVLVVGAGPVGLTLALELAHHGVDVIVVERNASTTQHPKMDVTNGRSMELYRRLGVADELRTAAIPTDHPLTVTWATNAVGWELASFAYPTVDEQRTTIRQHNDGTLPLEPAMRVSQVVLEPALRDLLIRRSDLVQIRYGWALERLEQDDEGVSAHIVSADGERGLIRASYLAGCDGASSLVRRQIGIELDEISLRTQLVKELGVGRTVLALARDYVKRRVRPPDGRIYLVHFTTPDREIFTRFGTVWHLQSPEGWTVISQNDDDTFTLHMPLSSGADAHKIDPREFVYECVGRRFEMNVLQANAWTPRLTVAESFGSGRVWLAGDAVHQVPPTGGYGMNTGVGDAVGLGWVLAAQLHGWGAPGLLRAYEQERRAVALRNRSAATRHSLVRAAIITGNWLGMHSERWMGERTRRRLGREIADLGNLENEAFGIEIGYRYDTSPAVCHEPEAQAPRQTMDHYTPSTWPGARPPSMLLADGTAIFDRFQSRGFTLIRFADHDVDALTAAAAREQLPLTVLDIRDGAAHALYERDLVLIRPDQHVAWRGNAPPVDPQRLIDRIRGAIA